MNNSSVFSTKWLYLTEVEVLFVFWSKIEAFHFSCNTKLQFQNIIKVENEEQLFYSFYEVLFHRNIFFCSYIKEKQIKIRTAMNLLNQ